MTKLGMKAVPGVSRVTIRKNKNTMFVIAKPDVFKSPTSDTYVIFGEAKVEDAGAQLAQAAASRFAAPGAGAPAASAPAAAAAAADDDAVGDVDEAGVEAKDVELVMTQASVPRAKAVKALKEADGDIVSAIMALTM